MSLAPVRKELAAQNGARLLAVPERRRPVGSLAASMPCLSLTMMGTPSGVFASASITSHANVLTLVLLPTLASPIADSIDSTALHSHSCRVSQFGDVIHFAF